MRFIDVRAEFRPFWWLDVMWFDRPCRPLKSKKRRTTQKRVKHNSFGNETQLLTFCSWIVLLHDITNHYPHVRCVCIYICIAYDYTICPFWLPFKTHFFGLCILPSIILGLSYTPNCCSSCHHLESLVLFVFCFLFTLSVGYLVAQPA